MTLHLSRLSLRRDPAAAALRRLVDPDDLGRAADANHRLVWSAFADRPDRRRDFLWRADGRGRFITLSRRPPGDSPLFEPPETSVFAPALEAGDRLGFTLRANATVSGPPPGGDGKGRGRRRDVVMAALHDTPKGPERAARRMPLARARGAAWLADRGPKAGFEADPADIEVGDYSVFALPDWRGPRKGQPQFGVLDLTGVLTVTDPEAFVAALGLGFGRAKAFGCGLMLLRRA